ncbi:MAG: SEC-C metal-binding domain-containing protein [Candidatus Methanoperedens sp.]|nr:SEC-C metal-binding domain-containing protein [Candidatus Methanoperedens sp.]
MTRNKMANKMSNKIGRNDPCPCGSGVKYKRCCLNTKSVTINKTTSKSEGPVVSRLAIMKFEQRLIDNPKQLESLTKESEKHFNRTDISFKDFILQKWNLNKVKKMSTSEIIEKLQSLNINFEIEQFKEQAQNYFSAIQLSEELYYTQNFHSQAQDEDFIWLAIIELWNRIIPERCNIEMIDDLMQDGYQDIEKSNYRDGMENWEKAWNMIRIIVHSTVKSVRAADESIPYLTQSIFNWCQDFEMESGNAGSEDDSFYVKRIKYCQDFCRTFPRSDDSIIRNMLRAEAESYAALGDIETADKLFQGLIMKFPDNVWGYIGWGDMYRYLKSDSRIPENYDKAEEKYRLGLARCNTEIDVINERLDDLVVKQRKLLSGIE